MTIELQTVTTAITLTIEDSKLLSGTTTQEDLFVQDGKTLARANSRTSDIAMSEIARIDSLLFPKEEVKEEPEQVDADEAVEPKPTFDPTPAHEQNATSEATEAPESEVTPEASETDSTPDDTDSEPKDVGTEPDSTTSEPAVNAQPAFPVVEQEERPEPLVPTEPSPIILIDQQPSPIVLPAPEIAEPDPTSEPEVPTEPKPVISPDVEQPVVDPVVEPDATSIDENVVDAIAPAPIAAAETNATDEMETTSEPTAVEVVDGELVLQPEPKPELSVETTQPDANVETVSQPIPELPEVATEPVAVTQPVAEESESELPSEPSNLLDISIEPVAEEPKKATRKRKVKLDDADGEADASSLL
jgi:hypothetical protein